MSYVVFSVSAYNFCAKPKAMDLFGSGAWRDAACVFVMAWQVIGQTPVAKAKKWLTLRS